MEKLLLVDGDMRLKGLITIKDVNKMVEFPSSNQDEKGRLRVGAAVGVHDRERVHASGADQPRPLWHRCRPGGLRRLRAV